MAPDFPDAHNELGTALAKNGRIDEAIDELQKAIALVPTSVEYRFNLGFVMGLRGNYAGAVEALQKAVELSEGKDWRCLAALAYAYDKTGHSDEAIQSAQRALDLAVQEHDEELEKGLRGDLERYEREGVNAQPQ
jgi:Flp pilus assembly protein TadD